MSPTDHVLEPVIQSIAMKDWPPHTLLPKMDGPHIEVSTVTEPLKLESEDSPNGLPEPTSHGPLAVKLTVTMFAAADNVPASNKAAAMAIER